MTKRMEVHVRMGQEATARQNGKPKSENSVLFIT